MLFICFQICFKFQSLSQTFPVPQPRVVLVPSQTFFSSHISSSTFWWTNHPISQRAASPRESHHLEMTGRWLRWEPLILPGGLVAKDARSSNICHGHLDCLQPTVEWKSLFCFPHFLEMEMNSASVGALRYGNEHDSYRSHQWTCQIPPTLTFTSIETVDGIQSRSCNDGGWQ